jgi:hypothetical protein
LHIQLIPIQKIKMIACTLAPKPCLHISHCPS